MWALLFPMMSAFINTFLLVALKHSARFLEETNSVLRQTQQFLLRKTGAAFPCIWWLSLALSPGMNIFLDDFRNPFHCLNLIFFTAKTNPPKTKKKRTKQKKKPNPKSPQPRNLIRMLCNCCNLQHSFYLFTKWMFALLYGIWSEVVCKE